MYLPTSFYHPSQLEKGSNIIHLLNGPGGPLSLPLRLKQISINKPYCCLSRDIQVAAKSSADGERGTQTGLNSIIQESRAEYGRYR